MNLKDDICPTMYTDRELAECCGYCTGETSLLVQISVILAKQESHENKFVWQLTILSFWQAGYNFFLMIPGEQNKNNNKNNTMLFTLLLLLFFA